MKTTTSLNHLSRLKTRATDLFSAALCYKPTHADLLNQITETIYKDPAFSKLASGYRIALKEFIHTKFETIRHDCTIWLHINKDGKPVSWEMLTTEDKSNLESHSYWLDTKSPSHKGSKITIDTVLTITKTVTGKIWS